MRTSPAAGTTRRYFVHNMDCADCALRVKGAVSRLPGVAEPEVNFMTQTLSVRLDETATPSAAFERALQQLGYPADPQATADETTPPDRAPGPEHQPWFRTGKGRHVLVTGGLLLLAALLGLLLPSLGTWLFAAATALGVWPLARKAWAATRLGEPFTINTLVSVAALGAVAIGQAPEGALVVFLFAVGELLEGTAAGRARAGIRALAALAPKTALLLQDGAVQEVPVAALRVGQFVQVRPGGRVPADGTITEGQGDVDDSPVTGESMPVHKGSGDRVFAGSINTDGVLTVRVEHDASDNTISRIIHLVEEAEASRAPTARFIDSFSRTYTPLALLTALLVATLPPLLAGASWLEWIYKGIALLLIACPCALVLSVPAAVTSGISAGARRGLLIKGGATLEAIGKVRRVAFDKTGTLTQNRPRVTDVVALGTTETEVLRLAAAVEAGSSHPLATAITAAAATARLEIPAAAQGRALAGRAVTATVAGIAYAVGSPRYAAGLAPLPPATAKLVESLELQGKTVVLLLEGPVPLGLLAIRDELRSDARSAVRWLARLGVGSVMLTGDNARTGTAIAKELEMDVHAGLLPEDKLRLIRQLAADGSTAMVGDGINDAPALAQADVGIAMGGGTDVALETAGAALLQERVSGIPELIELSRATMRNIRQNVIFALGLKAVFLVTTLLGITGLWPAILSDTGATVLVTANALRLLRFRPSPAPEK